MQSALNSPLWLVYSSWLRKPPPFCLLLFASVRSLLGPYETILQSKDFQPMSKFSRKATPSHAPSRTQPGGGTPAQASHPSVDDDDFAMRIAQIFEQQDAVAGASVPHASACPFDTTSPSLPFPLVPNLGGAQGPPPPPPLPLPLPSSRPMPRPGATRTTCLVPTMHPYAVHMPYAPSPSVRTAASVFPMRVYEPAYVNVNALNKLVFEDTQPMLLPPPPPPLPPPPAYPQPQPVLPHWLPPMKGVTVVASSDQLPAGT